MESRQPLELYHAKIIIRLSFTLDHFGGVIPTESKNAKHLSPYIILVPKPFGL